MNLFISVVIPLYNKERYIANTIDSVLAQSHSNFELIIVDDGSTDSSLSAATAFLDQRIKFIQKKNGGVSSARNVGIASAKGDWIALLDADDQWTPNHLDRILQCIEACPDAAMISAHAHQVSDQNLASLNSSFDLNFAPSYIDYFNLASTNIFTITSSTVCLNKSAALAIGGFDEKLAIGEDLDMWARMALKYKVAHTNCRTGLYLRNTGGATDSTSRESSFRFSTFELLNPELIKLKEALNKNSTLDNKRSIKKYINKKASYGVLRALYLDNTPLAKTIASKYLFILDANSLGLFALTSQPAPLIEKQLFLLRWITRLLRK